MTHSGDTAYPDNSGIGQYGLTKRELFAAMAMQGMVSSEWYSDFAEGKGSLRDRIAENAVRHADALIKALNEGE